MNVGFELVSVFLCWVTDGAMLRTALIFLIFQFTNMLN
jgi:hypothetical protein